MDVFLSCVDLSARLHYTPTPHFIAKRLASGRMADPQIAAIQLALHSGRHLEAWRDFLSAYSPVILQAVRHSIWDPEQASDCFVFVCEQLRANSYRRLRQFRADGPTGFVTWLRVVVRNLCLDWHRKESGRYRVFESIARLPLFEQEVYRLCCEEGRSAEETCFLMREQFPEVTPHSIADTETRLQQSLSSRQKWLLASRQVEPGQAASVTEEGVLLEVEVADPGPDPEAAAISREERVSLGQALGRLEAAERLLLRLRFGQELTLTKIARFMGLADAQTADRRIREALQRLREEFRRR